MCTGIMIMLGDASYTPMRTAIAMHRRRKGTAAHSWAAGLFLISSLLVERTSAFCDELDKPNTWDGLVTWVDNIQSSGFGIVCPFEISGNGCPTESQQINFRSRSLYLICASFLGGSGDGCILDCPNTHFEVEEFSQLVLEGWTMRGTVNTPAVVVKPFGELVSYSSNFIANSNEIGNGGALHGEVDSKITLEFTNFNQNRAENGGAIYSQGRVNIVAGDFLENAALNSGGALALAGLESATIELTRMEANSAAVGPAVHKGSTFSVTAQQNEGCNNRVTASGFGANPFCDGVQNQNGGCNKFDILCAFVANPTSAPTQGPSLAPTSLPTLAPTVTTLAPTASPTSVPSTNDPISTRPSLRPTRSPTRNPTKPPTTTPTSNPTDSPTLLPTLAPSTTAPMTSQPSLRPNQSPTLYPTRSVPVIMAERPTLSPSLGPTPMPLSFSPTIAKLTTSSPTSSPSSVPTTHQTNPPTKYPSLTANASPTHSPSNYQSQIPSAAETVSVEIVIPTVDTSMSSNEPSATSLTSLTSLQQSIEPSSDENSASPSSVWSSRVPTASEFDLQSDSPTLPQSDSPSLTTSSSPTAIVSIAPTRPLSGATPITAMSTTSHSATISPNDFVTSVPSSTPSSNSNEEPTTHRPSSQPTQSLTKPPLTPSPTITQSDSLTELLLVQHTSSPTDRPSLSPPLSQPPTQAFEEAGSVSTSNSPTRAPTLFSTGGFTLLTESPTASPAKPQLHPAFGRHFSPPPEKNLDHD